MCSPKEVLKSYLYEKNALKSCWYLLCHNFFIFWRVVKSFVKYALFQIKSKSKSQVQPNYTQLIPIYAPYQNTWLNVLSFTFQYYFFLSPQNIIIIIIKLNYLFLVSKCLINFFYKDLLKSGIFLYCN